MNGNPIKIPGPDHPITITPAKGRITVTVNRKRVADTHEALTLKEAAYPAVQYIPRKHVDMTQLQRTSHQTAPIRPKRATRPSQAGLGSAIGSLRDAFAILWVTVSYLVG